MTGNISPSVSPDLPPTGASGPQRWLRPLLIASLALNLAIIGIVGGAALRGPRMGPPMQVGDLGFGPFTQALSPADRTALREAFLKEPGGVLGGRRDMRAEFGSLLNALRSEPFDAAVVSRIMEARQTRSSQRIAVGQKLLLDRITAMTPDDRKGFADRLERALRHGPGSRPPKPAND